MEYLYAFGAIFLLLILSALISGSEVAYFSLSPLHIKDLHEENTKSSKRILDLLEKPRFLLATILVANNFINVAIIILFSFVISGTLNLESLATDFGLIFEFFINSVVVSLLNFEPVSINFTFILEFIINILIVTSLLVLFGEVSPKVLATQQSLSFAKRTSSLLTFFKVIFYPLSWLLVKSGISLEKRLTIAKQEIDLDEIEKAIDLSTQQDSTKEDIEILKGIVHFGNTTVTQIMKPRIDVIALDKAQSYKEVIDAIKESGYSRIPVFEENIDKIVGTLYIKDLLSHLDESEDFDWQSIVREPIFVPESKKIDDLLREFQASRKHQAIVVDEYGGTCGLVTLEDILEEVVGDIKDEFDDYLELDYRKLKENTFLFEGKILLNDICRIIGVDNDTFDEVKGESDSLAGLIIEILGEIPKKGTKVNWKNYEFVVLSLDKHRIEKVKLTIEEL